MAENIVERPIEKDLRESYLDYAMSVIVGRAIPDLRDGLKPVHRRILFGMHELGNTYSKPHKKSARIVGEVLGKYHPHGDIAVYDSLVRMAQTFSLRYTLVNGQGNMGSVDGDSAAAMRYCITSDARVITDNGLEKIGMLANKEDISKCILSVDNRINTASKWFDSGEHPTKRITTYRGFTLTGTLNHPILVWEKAEKGRPRLKWKLFGQLKEGDYAVINRSTQLFPKEDPLLTDYLPSGLHPRTKNHAVPKRMNKELAFILGALVSEGSISKEQIGFCNSDEEFLTAFKSAFKKVFPDCRLHEYKRKPQGYTKKPYTSLEIHSLQVISFLKNLGLKPAHAAEKTVPEIIFKSTKECVSAFLKAYAEGDGSVYRSGAPEISFISMSVELLKEMQLLLLRFGIESSYRLQPSKNIYKLLIRGFENLNGFRKSINFGTRKKVSKLETICELNADLRIMSKTDFVPYISDYIRLNGYKGKTKEWLTKHNIDRLPKIRKNWETLDAMLNDADKSMYEQVIRNNYLFDEIVFIEDSGVQKVYSIRVDSNCHSFVSNGFISHNTEVRLDKIAEEMLSDIDKETVDFTPNFDGTLKEPVVLPSKIPNLLINGSSGIAVGMATNIPPHNLNEVVDAIISLIEGGKEEDMFSIVKGPDFPTGGEIVGRSEIYQAYKTGRGIIKIRGKCEIDEVKHIIHIKEIPYQVTKTAIIEAIADAVRDKRIEGVRGVHDRSDREGIDVVIELTRDASPEVVLNQIYTHTPLENAFGIINLVLLDKQPKILPLYEILREFVEFRKQIVTKRCKFDLRIAEERAHILSGLRIALDRIDDVVAFLRKSKDTAEARSGLMKSYSLSELQANAILDMKLQRLISLERKKIDDEFAELTKKIAGLKEILADINKILKIIKDELLEIKQKYGDDRRTSIIDAVEERTIEELIPNDEVVVVITSRGYTKRIPLTEYRVQRRGGKGVIGAETKEEDVMQDLVITRNHNYMLFFTDHGRAFWLKAYEIPEASRYATGKTIVNLLQLKDEKVTSWISVDKFNENEFLFFATRQGIVKRTSLANFSNPRKNGIIAITLKEGDGLVGVAKTNGKQSVLIATKLGQSIRFIEEDAREIGRTGQGVIGIRMDEKDSVASFAVCSKPTILTITENGYGKRTHVDEYRLQGRGGSGVINMKADERNGSIIASRSVSDDDEIIVITTGGQAIRVPVNGISVIGRNTGGVRIIRLEGNEKVANFAVVHKEAQNGENNQQAEPKAL